MMPAISRRVILQLRGGASWAAEQSEPRSLTTWTFPYRRDAARRGQGVPQARPVTYKLTVGCWCKHRPAWS